MISYIDTSYSSIALGLIAFVLIFVLARFLLLKYEPEEEESTSVNYKVLGISAVVAIVATLVVLVSYKQFIIVKGSGEILRDEF